MRTTTFTLPATAALLVAGVLLAPGASAAPNAAPNVAPNAAPGAVPAPDDQAAPGAYTAVGPNRILDTRDPGNTAVKAGVARTLQVAGSASDVPSGASAVVLNVTVTNPTSGGFLAVYPGGGSLVASNLNFSAGQTVANLVTVQLPSSGAVTIVSGGGVASVDVVVDVDGWFAGGGTPKADGAFAPLTPARLLDTRTSTPLAALSGRTLKVAGAGGVPSGAGAVVLNVTVTNTTAPGFVTAYPAAPRPTASNLNFVAGQTVPNLVVVPIGDDGTVSFYSGSTGRADLLVDVFGYFVGSAPSVNGMFGALPPARVLDTRAAIGAPTRPVAGLSTLTLPVLGRGGVPTSGVSAVVVNVTAVSPKSSGFLTVYAAGTTKPPSSNLNFTAGAIVPNLVVAPVSTNGSVAIYNGGGGSVDVVADVTGYVRNGSLSVPDASTSRYVNDLTGSQSTTAIATAMKADGQTDAAATSGPGAHLTILEFGAQSARAGGDGTGTGNQLGVRLPNVDGNGMRLTYAQVQAAMQGYLDGYAAGRPAGATGNVTVALGTSSDGFLGAPYTPAAKGTDWATQVNTAASYATGKGYGIAVVGADDIEAEFSATASEVRTWIGAYRAGTSLGLINNGATIACPSASGAVNQTCGTVRVTESTDADPVFNTWTQQDYVSFSAGTGITIAPQIYFPYQAAQWENVLLSSGGSTIRFAGVLTQAKACQQTGQSGCGDLMPTQAWATMNQELAGNAATASLTIPTVTDIRYP